MVTYDDLLLIQDEALNSDLEGMDVGADDYEEEDDESLDLLLGGKDYYHQSEGC